MPSIPSTALLAAALAVLALPACRPAEIGGTTFPQVKVLALRLASASRQTGRAGEVVGSPPAVQVVDSAGKPIAGVEVAFTVIAGDGSVSPAIAVTGADGVARAAWQLGGEAAQELRATAAAVPGAAVDLSALVLASTAGYKVDLRLLTDATDAEWAAFTAAAARIAEVVTGGLTPLAIGGTSCGGQTYSGTVEDLLILVRIHPIDGAGGVLGEAGPCVARLSNHLPALGIMNFDSADLTGLEANGHLDTVILHEMLHVVGFGTAWSTSLVHDPGKADSAFTGPQALAAALGWNGAPGSWTSVPLENCGAASPKPCGTGTQDAHWLEPVFRNELMTGWVSASDPGNPLSRTTAGSLADLGYTVNLDAADPFDLATAGLRAEAAAPSEAEPDLYLGDDVLRLPLELAP